MSIPSTAPRGLESKQTHEDEEETEFTRPETRNLTNMTTNHDNSSILMKDNSNNIMSKDYDISNKSDNAQSLHNLNKVRKIMIDRKKILKSQKRENSKLEEARRVYMERK